MKRTRRARRLRERRARRFAGLVIQPAYETERCACCRLSLDPGEPAAKYGSAVAHPHCAREARQ